MKITSLDAMEYEIRNQLEDIPAFAKALKEEGLSLGAHKTIFSGSGDSYAAALFAGKLSGDAAGVEDPYELLKNRQLAKDKFVVVVSVSGRTRTNLLLVKKLKPIARKIIAITANPDSPLARNCSEVILLRYRKTGILTSGTSSFTTSLLACASLLAQLPNKMDLTLALEQAQEWSTKMLVPRDACFLFMGSGIAHSLSYYGACKVQEVLACKAEPTYPEQFGHAQLFSVERRRDVVVSIGPERDKKTREVTDRVGKLGFTVHRVTTRSKNQILWGLEVSLHLQMLALSVAKRRRMSECAFVQNRELLRLSSGLIY